MIHRSKRGSLELSVNSIVIVVLAFTMLGLGLFFIRNQFTNLGDTTSQVQEQIKQQILDDLRTGNKPLSFPAQRINAEINEKKDLAFGVLNVNDQELEFTIQFKKQDSTAADADDGGFVDATEEFIWDTGKQTLKPRQSNVFPAVYTAPDGSGTLLYKIVITDESDGAEYASKSFFVEVS